MADRTKVYYDRDVDPAALREETVAVLGYGIQGRSQALNLRDSGVKVVVGNRPDRFRERAREDGFEVRAIGEAAAMGSLTMVLIPDEVQPGVLSRKVLPALKPGDGLVFAHGFVLRYGLVEIPPEVDVMLLAPRMPGHFLRERYLRGGGVPAFVSVERDATGRARRRLLGLAGALGITRCGAFEVDAAVETELDHFAEHFVYPLIFRSLEIAFEELVRAGYPPEVAVMELHGSEEIGQVLIAAAREGLYSMIETHASPACQVGIARHWRSVLGEEDEIRNRIRRTLERIRNGSFAEYLVEQSKRGYPELKGWKAGGSRGLESAERRLRRRLRSEPLEPAHSSEPDEE